MRERSIKGIRSGNPRALRQVPPGTGLFVVAAASVLIWCLIAAIARAI